MSEKTTRRNFIVTSVAVAGGIVGGTALQQNLTSASKNQPPITTNMPERELGNTGVRVPIFGLGGVGNTPLSPGVLQGMQQAMGYTLSQPGVHCCVIAAETIPQLESNVEVARAFQQLNETALAEIEQHTFASWQDNTFFRAWT